jgi:hypothetical protein
VPIDTTCCFKCETGRGWQLGWHCTGPHPSTSHHLPSADEVAWLFNLRGGDVPYNPVFLSYGVVTAEGATLYVDSAKVTPE